MAQPHMIVTITKTALAGEGKLPLVWQQVLKIQVDDYDDMEGLTYVIHEALQKAKYDYDTTNL